MQFTIENNRVTALFPYSDTGPTRDDERRLVKAIEEARRQAAQGKDQ